MPSPLTFETNQTNTTRIQPPHIAYIHIVQNGILSSLFIFFFIYIKVILKWIVYVRQRCWYFTNIWITYEHPQTYICIPSESHEKTILQEIHVTSLHNDKWSTLDSEIITRSRSHGDFWCWLWSSFIKEQVERYGRMQVFLYTFNWFCIVLKVFSWLVL